MRRGNTGDVCALFEISSRYCWARGGVEKQDLAKSMEFIQKAAFFCGPDIFAELQSALLHIFKKSNEPVAHRTRSRSLSPATQSGNNNNNNKALIDDSNPEAVPSKNRVLPLETQSQTLMCSRGCTNRNKRKRDLISPPEDTDSATTINNSDAQEKETHRKYICEPNPETFLTAAMMCKLGLLLLMQNEAPQDFTRLRQQVELLADNGDARTMEQMSQLADMCRSVPYDLTKSREYRTTAFSDGLNWVQERLEQLEYNSNKQLICQLLRDLAISLKKGPALTPSSFSSASTSASTSPARRQSIIVLGSIPPTRKQWNLGQLPHHIIRIVVSFAVGPQFCSAKERVNLLSVSRVFQRVVSSFPFLYVANDGDPPSRIERAEGLRVDSVARLFKNLHSNQTAILNDNEVSNAVSLSALVTRLRRIHIKDPKIYDSSQVFQFIAQCTKLEDLFIQHRHTIPMSQDSRPTLTGPLPHLTRLKLSWCNAVDDSVLSSLLQSTTQLRNLYCNLVPVSFSPQVADWCSILTSLVKLHLSQISAAFEPSVLQLCANQPYLEKLTLSEINGTISAPTQRPLSNLRTVTFEYCEDLDDSGLGFFMSSAPQLRSLTVKSCSGLSRPQIVSDSLRILSSWQAGFPSVRCPRLLRFDAINDLATLYSANNWHMNAPNTERIVIRGVHDFTDAVVHSLFSPPAVPPVPSCFRALSCLGLLQLHELQTPIICSSTLSIIEIYECSKLSSLTLRCPSLLRLVALRCPSLKCENLDIHDCPALFDILLSNEHDDDEDTDGSDAE